MVKLIVCPLCKIRAERELCLQDLMEEEGSSDLCAAHKTMIRRCVRESADFEEAYRKMNEHHGVRMLTLKLEVPEGYEDTDDELVFADFRNSIKEDWNVILMKEENEGIESKE